jgi:phosphoglycolate phosphatase
MVTRYRELYPEIAIPVTEPMAGAHEAVHAVREWGARAMVVTAKNQRDAERTVRFLGLPVTVVVGELWAEGKAVALKEHGAAVYVGDHTGDVDAARAAGAVSVGVASGPYDVAALRDYGADFVLPDLLAFPDWFWSRSQRPSARPSAPHN